MSKNALPMLVVAGLQWPAQSAILFLAPFLSENVAITVGGLLVVEHGMPPLLAGVCLFAGIVVSDFFLYGLGVASRHNPWARRLLIRDNVRRAQHWLDEHLIAVVAVSRLVPGVLYPAFIACGWLRLPFRRFALATMVSAGVYMPAMLVVVILFGEAVLRQFGYWAWFALLIAIVATGIVGSRSPRWGFLARMLASRVRVPAHWNLANLRRAELITHIGMPPLGVLLRKASLAERIVPILFYLPLAAHWLLLGLRHRSLTVPTVANPRLEGGGLWGESKIAYLQQVPPDQHQWIAPFASIVRGRGDASLQGDVDRAMRKIDEMGLTFPLVAKPDVGWRGFGVRLIPDPAQLRAYIAGFPADETIILQRHIAYDGEAGVFYVRRPGDADGRLISLALRYFPHVVGDGRSTVRQLILRDPRASWKAHHHLGADMTHRGVDAETLQQVPRAGDVVRLAFIGSNRVGALYRDGRRHITAALTERINDICKAMPEFYFGRFDIRFESIERLEAGEDFAIIEINGAGAEAIHVWDPEMPIGAVYRGLFEQQRLLFEVGARNRARGFKPMGLAALLRLAVRQSRLIRRYPASG